jgi:hypothetical protein
VNESPARTVSLAAVLALLVGAGCRKEPPAPEAPADRPPPTPFYEWCLKHRFGIDAPQSNLVAAGIKNLPGAPVGDVELDAWTRSATPQEAEAYLAGVERGLRRAAQEHGVSPEPAPAPDGGFTIKYSAGRIRGTLKGTMELRDNEGGEKKVKRYFVRLSLTEVVAER